MNASVGPGSISFAPRYDVALNSLGGVAPYVVALADFDLDGWQDIAVTSRDSNKVVILKNNSSLSVLDFTPLLAYGTGQQPHGICTGDFDGDGFEDICVADTQGHSMSLFRNLSSGGTMAFSERIVYPLPGNILDVHAVDCDDDGKLDIVGSQVGLNIVSVFRNITTGGALSTSSFAPSVDLVTNTFPAGISIGDMNGDTKPDIAVAAAGSSGHISIFLNHSTPGSLSVADFSSAIDCFTGGILYSATIGDLDGDRYPDLIATNNLGAINIMRNYPLPPVTGITGTDTMCLTSGTHTYNNATAGGVWALTNTVRATINATTGVLTPLAPGQDTVLYHKIAGGDTNTAIFTIWIDSSVTVPAITGPASVCVGASITLNNTIADGVWSVSPSGLTTMTSAGNTVTLSGTAVGDVTLSYTYANSCGTDTEPVIIHVNGLPSAGAITGPTGMCGTDSVQLDEFVVGGVWSVASTSIATINSTGKIFGVTPGTTTVSYTVTNICGSSVATAPFSVHVAADAGIISGPASVCQAADITLSSSATLGAWSSSNTAVATVSSAGMVHGVGSGTATISYIVTNSCNADTATQAVTVNPLPITGTISGATSVCAGANITLSTTGTGGTWSSGTTSVATVAGGLVHGLVAGTTIISYSVTNGCGTLSDTQLVTVNPLPVAGTITGATSVCAGNQVTLSNATGGGSWSSGATGIATVAAGVVSGVTAGSAIISYAVTNVCGTATDTQMVVVNPQPTAGILSGANVVCELASVTLNTTLSGGTWTTSAPTVASVTSSGVVIGLTPGTATITYTRTNICGSASDTQLVTVSPLPVPGTVSGPTSVCAGLTISLTSTGTGGSWSSVATSIATTSGGVVGGVSAGTAVISYSVTNSCGTRSDTQLVTVNPQPNAGTITGGFIVCQGQQLTLSNIATGGSWSSGTTSVATINTSGIVFGTTPGTSVITYYFTNVCGTATDTQMVTVNPAPFAGTITGIRKFCAGTDITLSNTTGGGTWSSGNIAAATVAGGVVHGVATGFAVISYSVSNSCGTAVDTHRVQVDPQPVSGTITGPYQLCTGNNITLTGAAPGGSWSSSSDAIATVAVGVVHGNTVGVAVISYSVTNICGTAVDTQMVTVNLSPDAGVVSGPTSVCVGAQVSLVSTVPGGSWSSGSTGVATVSGGIVGGVAQGNAIITYTLTNGCGTATDTQMVRVDPLPFAGSISGGSTVCTGNSLTLTASMPGGVWAATNTSATVTGGVVTAVSPGSDTITYTVTNGCGTDVASHIINIELSPDAGSISGAAAVCAGQDITLAETVTGGTWSASNSHATVVGGVVTGMSRGNVTISYSVTNSCGTVHATHVVAVDSVRHPGIISGPPSVCTGVSATLTDTAAGGVWSVSNTTASVTPDGIVTGVSIGTDTIVYSVTNGCGTTTAIKEIVVNNSPYTDTITGLSSVCQGASITLADATAGGVWTSANGTLATVDATGVVTGQAAGTVTISYQVTSVCGTATATHLVTVNPLPDAGAISGTNTVCIGTSATLTASVAGGSWGATNANASITAGVYNGITAGADTILYMVSNVCGTDTASYTVTISPMADTGIITGPASVCQGADISLSDIVAGGTWTSTVPSVATVSASGVVSGVIPGTAVIRYTVGTGCSVQSAHHLVTVKQLPSLSSTILPPAVCDSTIFNYLPASTIPGSTFSWSRNVVSGIANAAAAGTNNVSETLDNTTPYPIAVIYQYIISATGCADTADVEIVVKPTPQIMQSLFTALCGDTLFNYTLSSYTPGAVITWVRNPSVGIAPTTASGTGNITDSMVNTVGGTVPAIYTISLSANGCSNVQQLQVMLSEGAHQPHITTKTASVICKGSMYQNFGTSDSLYAGEQFTWSVNNEALIWATGAQHKYVLVNFNGPGMAWIYLSNTQTSSGCTLRDSMAVLLEGGPMVAPAVARSGTDFICLDNDAETYQWGYDDKVTLDSTLLSGETNQNYYNATPDLSGKYYWVITIKTGCAQKAYYNAPVAVTNVNAFETSVTVTPNPNNGIFQVLVSAPVTEQADITVTDVAGRIVLQRASTTNARESIAIDVATGVYFVTVRSASGTHTERVVIAK